MWVFWTALILFTSLGVFITGIFLYHFVWDPWVRFRQRKKDKKTNRPKKFKPKKAKESWLSQFFGIILMVAIFGALPAFCFYIAIPIWLDLPTVLKGNYAEKTGILTRFAETDMSGRKSWGYPYYLYLDYVFYNSIDPIYAVEGETITIQYLPNTKVVVGYNY